MRWPYMVVLGVIVSGMMVIGANKISGITQINEESTITASASNFEKSPAKLKEIINTHRKFHEKAGIVFASLIEELEPHIEYSDAKELKEAVKALLDQYSNEINKADEALQANNIFLTNNVLARITKELKNIYMAQETLLELKRRIAPQPPKQKSNETVKSASIPGKQTPGMFF